MALEREVLLALGVLLALALMLLLLLLVVFWAAGMATAETTEAARRME